MGCCQSNPPVHTNTSEEVLKTTSFIEIYKKGLGGHIDKDTTGLLYTIDNELHYKSTHNKRWKRLLSPTRVYEIKYITSILIKSEPLRLEDDGQILLESPYLIFEISTHMGNAVLLAVAKEEEMTDIERFVHQIQTSSDIQYTLSHTPPPYTAIQSETEQLLNL